MLILYRISISLSTVFPMFFRKKHAFSNEFLSNIFNSQNRHFSDTQHQKAQYQPSEERIRRWYWALPVSGTLSTSRWLSFISFWKFRNEYRQAAPSALFRSECRFQGVCRWRYIECRFHSREQGTNPALWAQKALQCGKHGYSFCVQRAWCKRSEANFRQWYR